MALSLPPTADVSIVLSSSDPTEGAVNPNSLTFTTANWSTPQIATVTGIDDGSADGDVAYSVVTAAATSTDGYYDGINPSDVSVLNLDYDTAGIIVVPQ